MELCSLHTVYFNRHSYSEAQVPRRTSNYSGAPECPRCEQAVYFAEEVIAIGTKWHKACLKCSEF